MFKSKNKTNEDKKYKGTTLFVTKYDDVDVEVLLNLIVKNIEGYVRQEHKMPEKLRLTYDSYLKIINYKSSLIEKRDGKSYTFGVEIEI